MSAHIKMRLTCDSNPICDKAVETTGELDYCGNGPPMIKIPDGWYETTYHWQYGGGDDELRHYCPTHAEAAKKRYGY